MRHNEIVMMQIPAYNVNCNDADLAYNAVHLMESGDIETVRKPATNWCRGWSLLAIYNGVGAACDCFIYQQLSEEERCACQLGKTLSDKLYSGSPQSNSCFTQGTISNGHLYYDVID